jgi:release factor glutamine methyltransferase
MTQSTGPTLVTARKAATATLKAGRIDSPRSTPACCWKSPRGSSRTDILTDPIAR